MMVTIGLQNHSDNDVVFFKEVAVKTRQEIIIYPEATHEEQRFFPQKFLGSAPRLPARLSPPKPFCLIRADLFADVPPSDRVRFGIIGIGMQGCGLLPDAIQLPGVECIAACDLYDGRHALASEIVEPESSSHPPLSRTARQQGHRLHHRRRP